ncbi:MAG: response regulator, partial [Planctomycetes bacterium]|nr:response regulator [Planctomycetota bacterium]
MSKRLRVLLLEDRETDARLLLHALRKAGFDPDSERVDSGPAFLARLDPLPDLILADHHLPQFDALQALEAVQARGLDIP